MMTPRNRGAVGVVSESASAGSFVGGLAAQDFAELAVDRDELAWAHGDGLVLRGLICLPAVLSPIPSKPRRHR